MKSPDEQGFYRQGMVLLYYLVRLISPVKHPQDSAYAFCQ